MDSIISNGAPISPKGDATRTVRSSGGLTTPLRESLFNGFLRGSFFMWSLLSRDQSIPIVNFGKILAVSIFATTAYWDYENHSQIELDFCYLNQQSTFMIVTIVPKTISLQPRITKSDVVEILSIENNCVFIS
jgi:hypothetical protein